jgi:hypothetical protein
MRSKRGEGLQFLRSLPDTDECIEWPWTLDTRGYPQTRYDGRTRTAHRVSFLFANGREADGQARHTCDNKPCVNPRHIIEGTQVQNMQDAVDRRRYRRKLTDEQVAEIRASDEYQAVLGARYGVSQAHISRIKRWQNRTGVVQSDRSPRRAP